MKTMSKKGGTQHWMESFHPIKSPFASQKKAQSKFLRTGQQRLQNREEGTKEKKKNHKALRTHEVQAGDHCVVEKNKKKKNFFTKPFAKGGEN